MKPGLSPRLRLGLVLAIAYGLRLWLAAGGGLGYWPDENIRYGETRNGAYALVHQDWAGARHELLGHADHLLFRWVALPPAMLDQLLGPSPFRAAAYFGLFSVAIIALVWALARREGSDEEAFLAAFLAACANTLFFYARHALPYDASLALMLAGLWVGLGEHRWWRVALAGFLVGAGFLTYNGYWLVGGVILVIVLPKAGMGYGRVVARGAVAGTALVATIGLMIVICQLAGTNLLKGWRETSGTITQGDFGQGVRLIGEYLWSAEGPFALGGVGALVAAGMVWRRTRDGALLRWAAAILLLLGGLVLFSDVIHKFVVYGRLVRPVVPLACLLAARLLFVGIAAPAGWRGAVLAAGAACAAWNFAAPLRQVFPVEFLKQSQAEARRRQAVEPGIYRTVRAEHLWGADLTSPLPPHQVLMRAAHPLQFRPYLYEGFSVAQRAELARADISMRLIRIESAGLEQSLARDPQLGAYPGPLRLRVRFPADGLGKSEPLLTTGVTFKGDFFYVLYEDSAHVRFGFDHWGVGGAVTAPIPVDYSREHELVVSLGSLMPPADADCYRQEPWTQRLRRLAYVTLDGQRVLWTWSDFFPTAREDISIGSNFIGGTSTQIGFTGRIEGLQRVPLADFARQLPFAWPGAAARDRGPAWQGTCGPFVMKWRLPAAGDRGGEPLYSARGDGWTEALLVEKIDDRSARLRFERSGAVYRSEPFPVEAGRVQELRFSSGALWPVDHAPLYDAHPEWRQLRRLTYAACDGRIVMLRSLEPPAQPAREVALATLLSREVSGPENFNGTVESMAAADPAEVLRQGTQLDQRVAGRGPAWAGYPGPVRLRLQLPREFPAPGVGEPLIVSGATGAGDMVAVFYEADGTVRFGIDHWGLGGLPRSEPVRVRPGEPIEVVISAGLLWPPSDAALYRDAPDLRPWRDRVVMLVNGRKVLDTPAPTHSAAASTLTLGVNLIGGSTTGPNFTGIIEQVEGVAPGDLNPARP